MNIAKNWEEIKNNLRKEFDITDILYNTWIKPLEVDSIKGNVVTISTTTKTDGIIKYLTNKYSLPFKSCISEFAGKEYDVVFVSKNEGDSTFKDKPSLNEPVLQNVNPQFNFDTFVVGNNNKLAHAIAMSISEDPDSNNYNPFFIYSGVGLGKTHLMNAIANEIAIKHKNKNILYTTAEDFGNDFIKAFRKGVGRDDNIISSSEFKDKYRNLDVLLIDDIQFIIGKESTQQEFFHTFNTLINNNKQIIISSDRAPKDLDGLDERFKTRFNSGLIVEIDIPDFETKVAIFKNLMDKDKLTSKNIPDDVIFYICNNVKSNIRDLLGCYNIIKSIAILSGKNSIDIDTAMVELKKRIIYNEEKEISLDYIMEFVADHFNIDVKDITSGVKERNITKARHTYMYLCRKYTQSTLQNIAETLGNMDHSSVNYGINKIDKAIKKDDALKKDINTIIKKLNL